MLIKSQDTYNYLHFENVFVESIKQACTSEKEFR